MVMGVAALRYGVMGAPGASPAAEEDEPWDVHARRALLRKYEARVAEAMNLPERFEWV